MTIYWDSQSILPVDAAALNVRTGVRAGLILLRNHAEVLVRDAARLKQPQVVCKLIDWVQAANLP